MGRPRCPPIPQRHPAVPPPSRRRPHPQLRGAGTACGHRPDPSCLHRATRLAIAAGTERAGQLVGVAERDDATSGPPGGCLMQYVRLGRSGLKVSRIALGCMSYGDPSRGFNTWSLDEEASQPFFRQAVELGIDFWDTANVYQFGSSEEFVGRAVKRYTRR